MTKPRKSASTDFEIFGMLAAPVVPLGYDDGRLRVQRLGPGKSPHKHSRPTNLRSDGQVNGQPADVIVDTDVGVAIRVQAANDEDAVRKAHRSGLSPLVALLAASSDNSAFVDMRAVGEPDKDGWIAGTWSPFSKVAFLTNPSLRPMTAPEREKFALRMQAVGLNQTALDAATDLAEGVRMAVTHGGVAPVMAAAVLRLFHVVERICKAISPPPPSEQAEDQRRAALVQLRDDLDRARTTRQEVAAVRTAATTLSTIDASGVKARIRAASERLGVPDSHRVLAIDVADFRNKYLGHPTDEPLDAAIISPWATRAREAASVFFLGYADYLVARRANPH